MVEIASSHVHLISKSLKLKDTEAMYAIIKEKGTQATYFKLER